MLLTSIILLGPARKSDRTRIDLILQSVLIHNLQNPEEKRELLTEEAVELLTSPLELATYKESIMETMFKGAKREVESEDDSKNAVVG